MKKILNITALLILLSANLSAQYSTDWIRPADTYQKTGVTIARDNQDNVIASGYWTSYNMFTRKYNKFGVLQWEAISASGIPSNYEKPLWVTTDNNNNVYVAGYRYAGTGTAIALIILKYSASGIQLWKKVIDPVNYLAGMSLRCEVDNNGNLYVGACGVGTLPGFALIKLDPDGNILFMQNNAANAPGGFRSMRLKGNKIVLSASSAVGGNPSIAQIAVWDTTGNLLWTAGLQGRGGTDVEIDDAGNVYLLTSFSNQVSPTSQMDIDIYKFNASGTQLWKKDFDFGGYEFSTRFTYVAGKLSVIGDASLAAGYFDWITFQVDTDGNMIWNTRYNETTGNDEEPYFLSAKANGEVFVTGKGGPMFTLFGSQYLRMITLKYDNTGTRKWVDSVNIYSGWGLATTLASDSSLYVLSGTSMTVFHFLDHNGTAPPPVPVSLNVANITDTSATFSWTPVAGATLYHLRYRVTGTTTWTTASINVNTINITGLLANTLYDYACESVGSGGPSGYSATQVFSTLGPVLPINGIDIVARRQGANVLVSWTTQSEQNSAWFEIERSYDGANYIKIGQVLAAGNSTSLRSYQFTDINANMPLIFYRIKMTDVGGSYKLSLVSVVKRLDQSVQEFLLFPNPAAAYVNIVLNEFAAKDMQVQVINQTGQVVKTEKVNKGTQLIKFDINGLPKGMYTVALKGNDFVQAKKLLVR
jgi:hypothetical protein